MLISALANMPGLSSPWAFLTSMRTFTVRVAGSTVWPMNDTVPATFSSGSAATVT